MLTLNPARRRIVLTGTLASYGPANDGYSAAVFGPSTGAFTIINTATIANDAQNTRAAGLLLAAPGTINNFAAISSAYGAAILLESPSAGGEITNRGRVTGGTAAIQLNGPGAVRNAGYLQGAADCILLAQGGYVLNTGFVGGAIAVDDPLAAATIRNTGLIAGGAYAAILAAGSLLNTGTLQSAGDGVTLQSGAITNQGEILAPGAALITGAGGVTNTGEITAATGIESRGAAAITNGAAGTITATASFGIYLLAGGDLQNQGVITGPAAAIRLAAGGTITNAGNLRSAPNWNTGGGAPGGDGILAAGPATITNTGSIYAWQTGIAATGGAVTNAGSISADAGIFISGSQPATIKNTGFIAGNGAGGVYFAGPGYLYNHGLITAAKAAAGFGAGGTIVNTGTLTGADAIANDSQAITITNRGSLSGSYYGIGAADGGFVTNTGIITARTGLRLGSAAALDNAGLIEASGGDGMTCVAPGLVTNTGTITATQYALAFGGAATVDNTALLAGLAGGIDCAAAAYLTNSGHIQGAFGIMAAGPASLANTGIITGSTADGADFFGPAAITNAGTIAGAGIGLLVTGAAGIVNTGLITGATYGILAAAGATITNAGTIAGGAYAIQLNAYFANRLIIDPGSKIIGAVDGGAGTLELAAGTATGTFSAAQQTQFAAFTALQIDPGATWDFSKSFTLAANLPLLNNGTIREAAAGTLTIDSPLTGAGAIALAKHPLTLNAGAAAAQRIIFTGTNETLALGDPAQFGAKLETFAPGDTIDLTSIPLSSITATHFAAGILTLAEPDATLLFTFANPAAFGTATFALSSLSHGIAITLSPPPQTPVLVTFSH